MAHTLPKKSPLVIWVNSLQDEKYSQKEIKDYSELSSGIFLNKVWLQIDPQPPFHCVTTDAEDTTSRIRNLSGLLNNIKAFYDNILGQTLVLRLPDVIKIATNPSDESSSCEEMRVLLLLLLGCAVQCERKEHFIEGIKQLDISVQHSIVECIQQIKDNPESVWLNSEWNVLPEDELERQRLYGILVQHNNRLVKERDELFNRMIESESICPNDSSIRETSNCLFISSPHIINSVGEQKSHILVELADVKSKLRRVQQELEEKNEVVSELKEILEQNTESCNKLRHDNLELIQEARSAKAYRDEIDVLNERVRKVDRLESEVQRYREKINELDFYKSRVEELREDNRILSETKSMLEEQLDTTRKRADQLPELEAQILKLSAFTNELKLQKELNRNQIETLVEEITHLRLDKKSSSEELTKVQSELTHIKCQMKIDLLQQNGEGNLFDQINNDASKRVLKLELENQRLLSLVENIKNNRTSDLSTTFHNDNNNENFYNRINREDMPNGNYTDDMLSPRDVSMTSDSVSLQMSSDFNAKLEQIENENQILRSTVERVKRAEFRISELETLKNDLQKELIEMQSKQSSDSIKYQQIETNSSHLVSENQRLQQLLENQNKSIEEMRHQIEALESENHELLAAADTLKASIKRIDDLEQELNNFEENNLLLTQENKSSEKEILRLKAVIDTTIEEYANKLTAIELENNQLKKDIDDNNQTVIKYKELEKQNEDISNELLVCKTTISTLRETCLTSEGEPQQVNDKNEIKDPIRGSDDTQLAEKVVKLEDENKSLNEEHKRLQTEYKMLQNIYKKLRIENNDLKLKHTELQGETAECRDRMALLDVEVAKLANYCEMVALTNNSIESQRKRLINNISNLLSQYHELLSQIGGQTEKVISDKMHDLSAKKDRLEKMIKDYDLTLEKKKVAVSNHNVVRRIHRSSTDLCLSKNQNNNLKERSKDRNSAPIDNLTDEAIYGRIWEAETPPIPSSAAILRQFQNASSSLALEQSSSKSPEVIKQLTSDSLNQIKEEILESENKCVISPVPPPRPPPRVSTTIENKIQVSVITNPTQSPINASSTSCESPMTRPNSQPYNGFTRGTFKSNSINYGSPIRRQQPFKNGIHHINHFHQIHPHSASPSLNSDSSLTPLEDSELSDSAVNNHRSRNLSNINNSDAVTVNSNATNSIWYEYGCV